MAIDINLIIGLSVGGGALLLILLCLAVCLVCFCCCRKRNGSYVRLKPSPLDGDDTMSYRSLEVQLNVVQLSEPAKSSGAGDIGVKEAFAQQKQTEEVALRETAVIACQFYLRNTRRYLLVQTLPDLGTRIQKVWFLVSQAGAPVTPNSVRFLLSMVPIYEQCLLQLDREGVQALTDLLHGLQHPYLYPVVEIDYIPPEKNFVVVIQPLAPMGSLKDLIYKTNPIGDWSTKYSGKKKGLSEEEVALYGRQVLEAMAFLYDKGFPQIGHVHSGNVIVEENLKCCRLSSYENRLLGYQTRRHSQLQGFESGTDVLMFGYMIFEMACGYELVTVIPTARDLKAVRYPAVVEVLELIFSKHASLEFPSVQQLLEVPFFRNVSLPELAGWDSSQVAISPESKALLKLVRKGKSMKNKGAKKAKKEPRRASKDVKSSYPVFSSTEPGPQSTQQQPAANRRASAVPPPPPPPPQAAGPPRSKSTGQAGSRPPPPPTTERSALLGDIRKGARLKKTVTNDRSAPKI